MDILATLKFAQEQYLEAINGSNEHSKVSHLGRVIALLEKGKTTGEEVSAKINNTLTTSFKSIEEEIEKADGELKERLMKLAGKEKMPIPERFQFEKHDFSPKTD